MEHMGRRAYLVRAVAGAVRLIPRGLLVGLVAVVLIPPGALVGLAKPFLPVPLQRYLSSRLTLLELAEAAAAAATP
jgi:hypothetical protein